MTETEEFVSGFCKAQNQTRMVLCEYEINDRSEKIFLDSDCNYGACPHTKDCILMHSALEGCVQQP